MDLESIPIKRVFVFFAGNIPDRNVMRLEGLVVRFRTINVGRMRRRAIFIWFIIIQNSSHITVWSRPLRLMDLWGAGDDGCLDSCGGHNVQCLQGWLNSIVQCLQNLLNSSVDGTVDWAGNRHGCLYTCVRVARNLAPLVIYARLIIMSEQ